MSKYHLKIKWKDYKKTEAIEIVLYDNTQPLAKFKSLDEARIVRVVLNEQEETIQRLKETISEQAIQLDFLQDENKHMKDVLDENKQLKERIKKLRTRNIKLIMEG